jgi:para-aminobenzoate synthetase / 4-amino-4-deoxychorismate lyase
LEIIHIFECLAKKSRIKANSISFFAMCLLSEEQEAFRKAESPFILLESGISEGDTDVSYAFLDPVRILTYRSGQSVEDFFASIESEISQGYWLCGYFSYEFGYNLEEVLQDLIRPSPAPLVWLGVFASPKILKGKLLNTDSKLLQKNLIQSISTSVSKEKYFENIDSIHQWIANGKGYQLNYTFGLHFDLQTDPLSLYCALGHRQPTRYQSYIFTGEEHILSFSPELFFQKKGKNITVKPMKGTFPRGKNISEDEKHKIEFLASEKIRAENVMIVDLLRNDLGRIGENVCVEKLFEVETYPTLFQMTSTISAEVEKEVPWEKVFRALFPCGSITGAPKIEAMKKISTLENSPRGVYTGAIGFFSPSRDACFSVAIRTLYIAHQKGKMGVGGGIVHDSDAQSEYEEAITKSLFLTKKQEDFCLKEKILWEKGKGFFLLKEHLERIEKSAEFFKFPLSVSGLQKSLFTLEKTFVNKRVVVSVVLLPDGSFSFSVEQEKKMPRLLKAKFSFQKVEKQNLLLQHKTSVRKLYEKERAKAIKEGFFEVIFTNADEEVTEGSITNIFIENNGMLYTPPVSCGLLPGTLRASLLKSGKCREKILYKEDVFSAEKVFIGNSIRGLQKVVFVHAQSDFAKKVFAVVKKIPRGKVMTYAQVASIVGNPKAFRSIGSILAKNTDPKKFPCHRVIRSDGFCGEYEFGGRKAKIKKLKEEGLEIDEQEKVMVKSESDRRTNRNIKKTTGVPQKFLFLRARY